MIVSEPPSPAGRADAPVARPTISCVGLLIEYLKQEGVEAVFTLPGGPLTPVLDGLYHERSIRTISARHEGGAAFMALGYARMTGRLGVCCVTTGPGATNAITGVAAAKADSLPMLVVTAQVATSTFGKGSVQDSVERIDIVEMFKSTTKLSMMLSNPQNLAMTLRRAIRTAMTGRRGPVHLNIPTDMMRQQVRLDLQWPQEYRSVSRVFDREAVKQAAAVLLEARRPAILAGHGIALAAAEPELRELAELLDIPVATTPKGKGVFPEDHPLTLRVFGVASSPQAESYLLSGEVDTLCVLGSSLHESSTQCWEQRLQPTGSMIQLDIEPSVIGRNYPVAVPLVGEAKTTLRELIFHLRRMLAHGEHPFTRSAADFIEWKRSAQPYLNPESMASKALPMKPQRLMREISEALPDRSVVFIDSGNNTLWATHYLDSVRGRSFIHNWGEFGAMGFGVAAPIGAKAAAPGRPVVAIVGDGAFAMNGFEVSTAATYGIPVVWIVLNDSRLNAVYHGQQLQYAGRTIGCDFKRMDLAAVARALGADGISLSRPEEIGPALRAALAGGRPTVLDVAIDAEEVPPIHSRIKSLERFFTGTLG
jgi:acetolactate synthase-1/2/3 large subunit